MTSHPSIQERKTEPLKKRKHAPRILSMKKKTAGGKKALQDQSDAFFEKGIKVVRS